MCDDILANTDRHARNYGIIRNVETLECRMAPIFDSGTSLWCTKSPYDLKLGYYSFGGRQFNSNPVRQLLLVGDLTWLDVSLLDGFVDEAMGILSKNRANRGQASFYSSSIRIACTQERCHQRSVGAVMVRPS